MFDLYRGVADGIAEMRLPTKDGHHKGYLKQTVGDQVFIYCPRHPEIKHGGTLENALRAYDLHFEVVHLGGPLK